MTSDKKMRKQRALLDMSFEDRQKLFLKKMRKEATKHNLYLGTTASHNGYDWVGRLELVDAGDATLRARAEVDLYAPSVLMGKSKKTKPPAPPLADQKIERQRCQIKKYESFDPLTLKGKGHQKRCTNKPVVLLASKDLDEHGKRPFMSVCADCLADGLHDTLVATKQATTEAIPKPKLGRPARV